MAVVNTVSTSISNMTSTPIALNSSKTYGGYTRDYSETVEVAAADDDTSTYRLVAIPSNEVVKVVWLYNDAITGGTSYDIGVYYNSAKLGGVVVPSCVALFASAVDLSTAHGATGALDVTHEATATDIDKIKYPLWQLCGLTSDPNCLLDIVATANTAGSAAGTISVRVVACVGG